MATKIYDSFSARERPQDHKKEGHGKMFKLVEYFGIEGKQLSFCQ